jgi:hypothetical protein
MYDVNAILARLQNGETPDDIANDCARAINAAIELDKKNKEAEIQKAKEAELNGYISDMLTAMSNYLRASSPEVAALMDESDAEVVDPAELRKMLDASVAAALLAVKLSGDLDVKPSTPTVKATRTPDDSIGEFLKSFGL